nr:cache domain-containing protein [Gilvimarinus xylanilyticus]
MAIDAARDRYQLAAENTASYIESEESRGMQLTELLARYPSLMDTENQSVSMRDLFAEVMLNRPIFYSIYIGFPNGDFYEVINLDNGPGVREGVGADDTDRWAVNRVRQINGIRQRELYFYDSEFSLKHQRTEPTSYDVRERQWFIHAKHDRATRSEPYLFQYTQHAGKTFSVKIPKSEAVLAIDVTLDAFSNYLRQTNLGDSSEVYVYTQSGQIIASSQLKETSTELPAVTPLTLSGEERRYLDSLGRSGR